MPPISPSPPVNHVDHTLTDQTRHTPPRGERIGDGSYDALSGPLTGMFDFSGRHRAPKLFLDPQSGEPAVG